MFSNTKIAELLAQQNPICADCDEEGGGKPPSPEHFKQYEINDLSRIWYRVIVSNREANLTGKEAEESLLGRDGHVERMCVWNHLFAFSIYAVYLFARLFTPMGMKGHLSSTLVSVACFTFSITFFTSAVYHVYSPNKFWSAVTRLGDYAGIYTGISAGLLADLSCTTLNLKNVSLKSILDTWIGTAVLVAFFVFRRTQLSIDETRRQYFGSRCSLGLGRSTNTDLEHSSFRAGAGIAMAFGWIMLVPGGFNTLEIDSAWVFAGSRFLGTAILIFGMFLDNVLMIPDRWIRKNKGRVLCCRCYSDRSGCGGGWIMSSHALWHFFALASTVTTTIGSEYVVAASLKLGS